MYLFGDSGLPVQLNLRKQRERLEWKKDDDIWKKVVQQPIRTEEAKLEEGVTKISMSDLKGIEPWSDEVPSLYTLSIQVNDEHYSLRVGFRRVTIEDGIWKVNGKRIMIRGVNSNEWHPEHGRTFPSLDYLDDDLKLMKQFNFNAVRCSHYPRSKYFYELCD